MTREKVVFCLEKLGRMVSHSLHLATVVGRRGGVVLGGGGGGGGGRGGRQMHLFGAFTSNFNKTKQSSTKHLYGIQMGGSIIGMFFISICEEMLQNTDPTMVTI